MAKSRANLAKGSISGLISAQSTAEPMRWSKNSCIHSVTSKSREQNLCLTEESLRSIIENTPECIKVIAWDGSILSMNRAGLFLVEAESFNAVSGRSVFDLIAPESRNSFRELHQRVCAGESCELEYEIIGLKGARRWMQTHAGPIAHPTTGEPAHLAITRDITQRKQAEQAIYLNEERLRLAACSEAITLFEQDSQLRYTWLYPLKPQFANSLGRSDSEILPNEEGAFLTRMKTEVMRTGQSERQVVSATFASRKAYYDLVALPRRDNGGQITGVAGCALDITERKCAEENAARLAAIVEHSDDAIFSMDLLGTIRSWNRGAERLYGYSAAEAIGQNVAILVPEGHQDEQPRLLELIRHGQTVENYETARRRQDGSVLQVSLTVSPVKDSEGNITGISKVARDITEKVRAREILEHTVAQRTASLEQALAQMEDFTYSVSHDLRAPARAVRSLAQAAIEDYGQAMPPELQGFINQMLASADRMDQLIRDILDYSRVSRSEVLLAPVELDHLLSAIISERPDLQSQRAHIDIRAPLGLVLAHEPSLNQAVSNLLANALKFVAPGVVPAVHLWTERNNGSVRLWVRDNGIGINPKYHHRLFNVFERAHDSVRYEGTGIGLAIVRKAAEKMGGKVGLLSDGKSGSSFWIELPAAFP